MSSSRQPLAAPSRLAAPDDLVELGRISGAYGVRGWVRVHPWSADGETLLSVREWWLQTPASAPEAGVLPSGNPHRQLVQVEKAREHAGQIVALLAGVTDRDRAEALKATTVWVSRARFSRPDTDEYYWVDLVGCRLYGEDDAGQSRLMGEVIGLMDNGAHGVLRVARARAADDGGLRFLLDARGRRLEGLVPFVSAHVHTVDLENRKLLSNWPVD